jgi:hypothetical protein
MRNRLQIKNKAKGFSLSRVVPILPICAYNRPVQAAEMLLARGKTSHLCKVKENGFSQIHASKNLS